MFPPLIYSLKVRICVFHKIFKNYVVTQAIMRNLKRDYGLNFIKDKQFKNAEISISLANATNKEVSKQELIFQEKIMMNQNNQKNNL